MNEQMTTYVEPKDKTYRDSLRVPALSIKENRGFLFIFPPFPGAFLIKFPVNTVYSSLLHFLDVFPIFILLFLCSLNLCPLGLCLLLLTTSTSCGLPTELPVGPPLLTDCKFLGVTESFWYLL